MGGSQSGANEKQEAGSLPVVKSRLFTHSLSIIDLLSSLLLLQPIPIDQIRIQRQQYYSARALLLIAIVTALRNSSDSRGTSSTCVDVWR